VVRVAIFASGAGSNARNIIEHFANSQTVRVVLIATNNPDAGVINIAHEHHLETIVFNREQLNDPDKLLNQLLFHSITHVVLAGFLWKLPVHLIRAFPNRIINIHPALLPKFGGKGMYGHHVHEAVYHAREMESGITIHLVNEHYDEGKIIFQDKFSISPDDGPIEIEKNVRALEMQHFPVILERFFAGEV
jgi:phosphoribosylglycinamide formyltransferase 1